MPIETGLRTFLLADSNISAMIGARFYPIQLPQNPTLPSITCQRVSNVRDYYQEGQAAYADPRIQIDIWASTSLSSKELAELIRQRLSGYRGPAGSETILGAFLDSDRDFYDKVADITDIYRVSQDWFVWYREDTPPMPGTPPDSYLPQPPASASLAGRFWIIKGGPGEADRIQVCAKDSSGVYQWFDVLQPN